MPVLLPQMPLFHNERKEIVSGLRYVPEYINPATETAMIQTIDEQPWLSDLKRRVQHYGYKYDYRARSITQDLWSGPLPDWLVSLCSKLYTEGVFPTQPDQVIVNEYQPGQGITPHVDCIPCFGETIAVVSTGSLCMMEFTHPGTQERAVQPLEPRSLVVLEGDARYIWQHAIPQRKTDNWNGQKFTRSRRISLTFRTVIIK